MHLAGPSSDAAADLMSSICLLASQCAWLSVRVHAVAGWQGGRQAVRMRECILQLAHTHVHSGLLLLWHNAAPAASGIKEAVQTRQLQRASNATQCATC